ncbi:hypothetical protein KXW73_002609 [Aspergillus fumigatus]|nr:hypothetical protein KXW73_002609 [Aspergillus fumigatus]
MSSEDELRRSDRHVDMPPILPGGPINLIVAVSFGLFVPPRILNAAKYGGLNVHPSLLPEYAPKIQAVPQEDLSNGRMSSFRGPAPLHHTLLAGRTKTGVTLQTLHVKHFDHGVILQQTPAPGFEIPNPDTCTVPELLNIVAPKGAEILLDGIRKGLFVPPIEDAGWRASQGDEPLIHAAKIKPEDRHIDWVNWTWKDISRRNRVLGPLWNKTLAVSDPTSENPLFRQRRVILSEMEEVDTIKGCEAFSLIPGLPFVDSAHPIDRQQGKGLYVFTRDGKLIQIYQMKVEGEQNADGVRAALKARMLSDRTFHSGAADFTPFHNPLQ